MSETTRRPGAVTFVAIVLFVFGAGYIINALFTGIAATYFAIYPDAPDNELVASVHFFTREVPNYVPIAIGLSVVDLFFGALQITYGVKVLRLRPASRVGAMILVLVKFAYFVGYQVFEVLMIMPATVRFAKLHPPAMPGGGPPPIDLGMVAQFTTLALVGANLALQIAATVLIVSVLRSQTVKTAFAGTAATPTVVPPLKKPSLYTGYEDDETQPA